MPYLRCGSCGAKALPIATRCPACSEPIQHGTPGSGSELSALRPCRRCDSLLPANTTPCPWCQESVPHKKRPYALMGSVAAVILLAIGSTLLIWTGDRGSADGSAAADIQPAPEVQTSMVTQSPEGGVLGTLQVSSPPERTLEPTNSQGAEASAVQGTEHGNAPGALPPEDGSAGGSVAATPPPATQVNSRAMPQGAQPEPSAPEAQRSSPEVEPSPSQATPAIRWVTVVARNYANVRLTGSVDAEVLAIVRPGDTIELAHGELNWSQLRRGTLEGWVWVPALELQSEILQDERVLQDDRVRRDSTVLREVSSLQDDR